MLRVLSHARPVGLLLLFALCATGQTRTAEGGSEGSKAGTIKGRVVNESGQPLANAIVSLSAVGNPNIYYRSATDRDGTFRVTDLAPLRYLISASLPAYASDRREAEGPATEYRIGDSVTFVLIRGGVITGTVTNSNDDPVVAIGVRAWMVQDGRGRRVTTRPVIREVGTDDRGVYRIYGLPSGVYVVLAGGTNTNDYTQTGIHTFAANVPTYSPSSTRDGAAQITVPSGEEVSNVDIRYRGERGRIISGIVSGLRTEDLGVSVVLSPGTPNDYEWNTDVERHGERNFVFEGIGDGDYYLTAQSYAKDGGRGLSESRLVNVRDADITGIELAPKALASITGRVVLQESKTPECKDKQQLELTETSISAWHKDTEAARNVPRFVWSLGAPVSPDPKGNITLQNLAPSQYYFQARFTAKDWYLQSISIAPAPAANAKMPPVTAKPVDATRVWTNVKSGDRLSGLTVTLAQGAASLHGELALSEGETAPDKMLVYLVPAETEKADGILRFYGAAVSEDGKIALNNLAPGRYWILAQPVVDGAPSPLTKLRWPDETRTRVRLRREAEAAKMEIQFKPCQHVVNYELPLKSALPQKIK